MYKQDEVIDLIKWVWDNREYVGGLSFLPTSDARYAQMPYSEITEAEYEAFTRDFPQIDFSQLHEYEKEDFTTTAQELACVSGVCSLDEYEALEAAKDAHLIS